MSSEEEVFICHNCEIQAELDSMEPDNHKATRSLIVLHIMFKHADLPIVVEDEAHGLINRLLAMSKEHLSNEVDKI